MDKDIYLSILPYITLPDYVIKILEVFENNGYRAYVVGGAVRDLLRGADVHDYDIATEADPLTTKHLFSFCPIYDTGIKHGTVSVNMDGNIVEITTFRTDGEYSDSRHPESVVFTTSIEEDLKRRDFTVNAMALDIDCNLVDPFDGIEDLENNIIRAVGNPKVRFSEDALRIMRAYRFSANLCFEIDRSTLAASAVCSEGLLRISRERIETEWQKLLSAQFCSKALIEMHRYGILKAIFPQVATDEIFLSKIETLPSGYSVRSAAFFKDVPPEQLKSVTERICLKNSDFDYILLILKALLVLRTDFEPNLRLFCYEYGEAAISASLIGAMDGSCGSGLADELRSILADPEMISGRFQLEVDGNDLIKLGRVEKALLTPVFSLIIQKVLNKEIKNTKRAILTDLPNILSEIEGDKAIDSDMWRKMPKYCIK